MRDDKSHTTRIIGLFPQLLGVGGVQEAGRLTAAAIDQIAHRRGWSTDFVALNDPPSARSFESLGRTISLRAFGRAKIRFILYCVGLKRQLGVNASCIVLAAHPNLALVATWMHRIVPHLRVFVMAHGIEVWEPLSPPRRRALLRANLVLAPSSDTAKKLIDVQGVASDKVRKLAWPINPAFLSMAHAPENLPLPATFPNGRVILTVGRWASSERYKGVDELIRVIPRLRASVPELRLVAVGGGDDLPRLRMIAGDLGVADRVHFLDKLSREEIAACYAHADVFALPSTGEGFGLVFLEAMAFAKPLIGAACGGTIDVIEDGVNGQLVPPGDTERLAQALDRLLRDDSICAEMGRRGSELVRQKYRFDVFQAELEHILGGHGVRKQEP